MQNKIFSSGGEETVLYNGIPEEKKPNFLTLVLIKSLRFFILLRRYNQRREEQGVPK